jgi:hypothetical protein
MFLIGPGQAGDDKHAEHSKRDDPRLVHVWW